MKTGTCDLELWSEILLFFWQNLCLKRCICGNMRDENLIKLLLITSIFSSQYKFYWIEPLPLGHQAQLGRVSTSSSPGPVGQSFYLSIGQTLSVRASESSSPGPIGQILITRPNQVKLLHFHHQAKSGRASTCSSPKPIGQSLYIFISQALLGRVFTSSSARYFRAESLGLYYPAQLSGALTPLSPGPNGQNIKTWAMIQSQLNTTGLAKQNCTLKQIDIQNAY